MRKWEKNVLGVADFAKGKTVMEGNNR